LSFAQFEREVIGERIRDKIAASKKKGMWMGGVPPLGYGAWNHKLVMIDSEADTVRLIFRRYAELGSVRSPQGGANKQLPDPNSLFAASVSTRCARKDRPEAGRRPRYRKFESISLQRRVGCELPGDGNQVDREAFVDQKPHDTAMVSRPRRVR
jgi:hypothetical protein